MFLDFNKVKYSFNKEDNTYIIIGNLLRVYSKTDMNGDEYYLAEILHNDSAEGYPSRLSKSNFLISNEMYNNIDKTPNTGIYCYAKLIPEEECIESNTKSLKYITLFKITEIIEQSTTLKIPYIACMYCGKIYGFSDIEKIGVYDGDCHRCSYCGEYFMNIFKLPNHDQYDNKIYDIDSYGLPKVKYNPNMHWKENSISPFKFVPYYHLKEKENNE